MLLVVDVGNTNIVSTFIDENTIESFRTPTKNEYVLQKKYEITGAIISSVVPSENKKIYDEILKIFNVKSKILDSTFNFGIQIKTDDPKKIGIDRIVTASKAYEMFNCACIAIDFGTATTYDIVNSNGEFIGGLITAGLKLSVDALHNFTELLPKITLSKPKSILDCKNTVTSMNTGAIFSYIGQVEYIVQKIKEELDCDVKVIATGGLSSLIESKSIDIYDEFLMEKGLFSIFNKN